MKRFCHHLFMLLLVLMAFGCTQPAIPPEKTAELFTVALFKGNTEEVVSLLYFDEDVKQQDSVEHVVKGKIEMLVQESKKSADKNGGLKQVFTEPATYDKDGSKATVLVTAKFNNGEENQQNLELILDNGHWLIFLK